MPSNYPRLRDVPEETDIDLLRREDLLDLHTKLTGWAFDLMTQKNSDYAQDDDALQNFRTCETLGICGSEEGVLVRMTDKLQRLANLRARDAAVDGETELDTVLDVINYAVIYAAVRGSGA